MYEKGVGILTPKILDLISKSEQNDIVLREEFFNLDKSNQNLSDRIQLLEEKRKELTKELSDWKDQIKHSQLV